MNLNPDTVRPGRRRGNHSVECKNPNPQHSRNATFKSLPGALGLLARRAKKKKIHKDPYFCYIRNALGRQRRFRPERCNLIDALCEAFLNCVDLSTAVPLLCIERLAADLDVTVSRVSRLVNDVFIPGGLMYVHADKAALDKDPDFGMVWDRTHGRWFPKVMVLTDRFFEVVGADRKLLDKLHDQMREHLELNKSGLAKVGEVISITEARRRRQLAAFQQAWEKRKSAAASQKIKVSLQQLDSIDDRLSYAAELVRSNYNVDYLSPEEYKGMCWKILRQMGADTIHPPQKT